jgi:nucleotide-binding universal stress UspA family protein
VRHTQQPDSAREALEEKDAEQLLKHGAETLGDASVQQHVVVHASTGAGLWELAEREQADLVVFGSDYRTAEGAVLPGTSAERLLAGGPVAVAVAPAGYRNGDGEIKAVGVVVEEDDDTAAVNTAKSLASALGVSIAEKHTDADVVVVGSSPASPKGHVNLSGRAGYAIETSDAPVIAVARGVELTFSKGAEKRAPASKG